jgi:hypothetical protein
MARLVFIVSRQRPDLLAYLRREFAGSPDIEVISDRRVSARRRREVPSASAERRRAPRRQAPVDDRLQSLGWAIVWREGRARS